MSDYYIRTQFCGSLSIYRISVYWDKFSFSINNIIKISLNSMNNIFAYKSNDVKRYMILVSIHPSLYTIVNCSINKENPFVQ